MKVVQVGTIGLPDGDKITGVAIEATPDELRAIGNLIYRDVVVVPLEVSDESGV